MGRWGPRRERATEAQPPRRREVEHLGLGGLQHERAALGLHVVANQREQAVHQRPGVRRRVVHAQGPLDEVERAHLLAQRFVTAV